MQASNPLYHTKHIFRVCLLLVAALLTLVLGRSLFVPDTWGQYGWFRGANVAQQQSRPVIHAGDAGCEQCHAEQGTKHTDGAHATVRCEVCHAPQPTHAVGGKKTADMVIHKSRTLCLRCHAQLEARPKDFPQVQAAQHVDDNGGEWGEEVCLECHPPHSPM